jgi:hypothetical protein
VTRWRRRAAAAAVVALAGTAPRAGAQDAGARVEIVDAGPGRSGRLLTAALARPHALRFADREAVALPRDTAFATSVIVLGGTATVASRVAGDVIVVGGDLFIHPGAEIAGRAVAVGGCVYNSTLGTVQGARLCFRDGTFDLARGADGTVSLAYRDIGGEARPWLALPGFYGFQPPSYDRVNGLSLAWGPTIVVDTGRVEIDPRVTYRSDLGTVDPSVELRAPLGTRNRAVVSAARGTYTNDAWIRSDLVNAVGVLALGSDTRNYFRADRIEGRLVRLFEPDAATIDVYLGARTEDARSVNPDSTSESAPFSFFGRRDRDDGMLRPNPQGTDGRISSAFVGASGDFEREDVSANSAVVVEIPFDAPGGSRFVQATLDASANFLAFGRHSVHAGAHAVLTAGDPTPRQRYAYLGGAGTLATERLLGAGGDELLFVDGVYMVPIGRVRIPLLGSPAAGVRYAAGSAGLRELPKFTQNVGVRLALSLARVDILVNPATGETNVGLGVAVLR